MMTAKQLPSQSINKVYSTLVSSALAISVIVMGNEAVSIGNSIGYPEQVVNCQNEKTNVYTSFISVPCISLNIYGYSNNENLSSSVKKVIISEEKLENLKKLETIASLQDDWNANGAKAFPNSLISKARNIIVLLEIQPEIFPTACGSLQLEYDKQDGSHMEIEITENKDAEIFLVDNKGRENIISIQSDAKEINRAVNDFYG